MLLLPCKVLISVSQLDSICQPGLSIINKPSVSKLGEGPISLHFLHIAPHNRLGETDHGSCSKTPGTGGLGRDGWKKRTMPFALHCLSPLFLLFVVFSRYADLRCDGVFDGHSSVHKAKATPGAANQNF